MSERVHINIHIFLCVDSCNSHNWNQCQESSSGLVSLKRARFVLEGGVEISSRNVDPKALLAISAWRRQYPRSDNHLTLSRGGGGFWGIINVCCFCWIVCVCLQVDMVLHIPLLRGDVPDGTSSGTGTRENGHTQDTNDISITDWNLVQGNLGRNRLETWEDIGLPCLALLTIGSFWPV